MSITLDVLMKDMLGRILDETAEDKEFMKKISEITNLNPETLRRINEHLDEELKTFYEEFLADTDDQK